MTTIKIEPCKFCDEEKDVKVMSAGVCWVECTICKCRGPIELFEVDAVKSWNEGVSKERKK